LSGIDRAGKERPNTFIGSPMERVEDFRFLRGEGQYVDDLAAEGQWHAAIVRSSVAHGRIRAIDAGAALAMPGIKAVFTAADVPHPIPTIPFRRPNPTIAPYAQPVIAESIVRYVGEPVAVIVAERAELAEDAIAAVSVEIEHLPVIADARASRRWSPPARAMRRRHLPPRPTGGASASAPSASPPCRWSRAGSWRNGMPLLGGCACPAPPSCRSSTAVHSPR
jgi:CO/xanthine dehydrogenase Mo-binding subunit